MIGQVISHYRILEKLGEGGMGVVYKAEDITLGRFVAVKILPPMTHQSAEERTRFIREARLTSSLNHPNILIVHELEEREGMTFIVTEYIEGRTLASLLKERTLSVAEILDVAFQAASGLAEAHTQGIIHRDLKPENVMISTKGQVKVMDFGLARLLGSSHVTNPGSLIGTFAYMSPEQINEQEVDARSDIFSFGILLYQLAAGRLPFRGTTIAEMLTSILRKEPESPRDSRKEIPELLEKIIFRALKKDPVRRYGSMLDLKGDLDALIRPDAAPRPRPRRRWMPGAGIGAAILAVAAGVYLLRPTARIAPPPGESTSIAVLPFINLGPDDSLNYLRIGLADDIITRLSFIRSLMVKPTSAVVQYLGRDVDAAQAGAQLGADFVLEGRFTKTGDQISLTTQLVDVRSGNIQWGARFQPRLQDIKTMQDNVSYRIVNALELKLSETESRDVHKVRTASAPAYEYYLRGIAFTARGSRENNTMAVRMFERAVSLDDRFAEAYAALAAAYVEEFWSGYSSDVQWVAQGETMARVALSLDDRLATAHSALAFALRVRGQYREALFETVKALETDPRLSFPLEDVSEFYRHRGEFDKARSFAARAAENDPSFNIDRVLARIDQFEGKYAESVPALKRAIERSPDDSWLRGGLLAFSYIHLGMLDSAEAEIARAERLDPGKPETNLSRAMLETVRGNEDAAQRQLDGIRDFIQRDYALARHVSALYAKQGKTRQALLWMRKASALGNRWYSWYISDPWFDSVRSNPEYEDLMATMKEELDGIAAELQKRGL